MTTDAKPTIIREASPQDLLDSARQEITNLKRRYEEATQRENANADKAERYRRVAAVTSQALGTLARHCEAMVQEVSTLTAKATWDQAVAKVRQIEVVLDSALRSIV